MMLCGPGASVEIGQAAELLVVPGVRVTGLQLKVVVPSRKLTLPVGTASPVVPGTMAVKVTEVPYADGLEPVVRVTVTLGVTSFTTCEAALLELEVVGVMKLVSVPE